MMLKSIDIHGILSITEEQIEIFCQTWKIKEFYLFGSILRADFNSDSDVDVMVVFCEDVQWGLWEFIEMKWELERIFNRSVDLMTKQSILDSRNWLRREEILKTAELVYG